MTSVYVSQRPSKASGMRYIVRYRIGGRAGRTVHAGSFSSFVEAERCRHQIELEIARGKLHVDSPPTTRVREEKVYFARLADLIKIGVSIDPERRARELNAELLRVERGGRKRESELHAEFAKQHVSGEWFYNHPSIERYIAKSPRKRVA
jgi:hypothetical protein